MIHAKKKQVDWSGYEKALFEFIDKVVELADIPVDMGTRHKTKDDVYMCEVNGIETEHMEYADNPWKYNDPDWNDDPRSVGVLIGFEKQRWNIHGESTIQPNMIVMTPQGKDVHQNRMTVYQARGVAMMLNLYADFVALCIKNGWCDPQDKVDC